MPTEPQTSTSPAARIVLIAGGTLALGLGILGVVLPLVPATPFVLLAGGCYARAWPRAHRWLRNNRYLGPISQAGASGRYLPPRAKATAVVFAGLSFGVSISLVPGLIWKGALVAIGLSITIWLLLLPTSPRGETDPSQRA